MFGYPKVVESGKRNERGNTKKQVFVVVRVENAFFFFLRAVNVVYKKKMAEKEEAATILDTRKTK